MVKAVLFDFDGTLADTRYILFKVYERLAEKYDLKAVSSQDLERLSHLPLQERLKKTGVSIYKLPRLARETGQLFGDYIESAEPFPGIGRLLEILKSRDLLLSIVSSNTEHNIKRFLEVNNLKLFDHIRCTSSVFGKNRAIKAAIKELRLKSCEVVYVGDELRDIEACRKVPVKIIAVSWGYDRLSLLEKGGPDFLVHSPLDIESCLSRLD